MGKRLGRRKSHGKRKRPKRNKCGLGWCPVQRKALVAALGWPESQGWHISPLSRDWATVGCIDRIEKQYVCNTEVHTDWYLHGSAF